MSTFSKTALLLAAVLTLIPRVVLAADTTAKTPVYTKSATDVQSQPIGADGSTKPNIQGNNTAPGTGGGMQVLTLDTESSAPTCTAGRFCMPWGDTAGRLHIVSDLNLSMNIVQIGGATQSATNPLFVQLTDGTTAYIGAKTGQLPSSLGPQATGSSLSVVPATGSVFSTSPSSPTGVFFGTSSTSSLSGTSTVTPVCKGSLAVSTVTKIEAISVTSFNNARCICQYNDNGTKTVIAHLATSPAAPTSAITFPTAKPNLTTSATSTTQQVECACTGSDANQGASDVTCTVAGCQANSGC